jgi:hypothetical protein
MVVLRWLLKLLVLVLFTLGFLSLYQYGPGGFVPGFAQELNYWLDRPQIPTP